MIGAVLCLWQRAVDRLGDALEGPEMGNLRVTLAALSARVAAAEGEAARLRHRLWEADARAVSLQEKIDDWDRRYLEADRGNHAAEKKLTAERDEARAEVERLTLVRNDLEDLLKSIREATCKATFGMKACVLPVGHLGHHQSRSGSVWPQEGYQAPRYSCPCCKGPHALPVECAWKALAEGRAAEVERLTRVESLMVATIRARERLDDVEGTGDEKPEDIEAWRVQCAELRTALGLEP